MTQKLSLILVLIGILCVNGDQALIGKLCGWTMEPDLCRQYFWNQTESDEKGLAGASINYAYSLTLIVINEFDGIKESSGDQDVQLLCELGKEILGRAANSLLEADVDRVKGDFADAADYAAVADDCHPECSEKVVQKIPGLPTKFVDDFSTLKKYYLITEGILYGLSKYTMRTL